MNMNGQIQGQTFELFCKLIHSKLNRHENVMEQVKVRVWDKLEKKFYQTKISRNTLSDCTELLMSQEGEIYIRERENGVEKLTHEKNLEFEKRFIKDLYVGIRDNNDKKYFFNDIVKFTHKQRSGPPTHSFGVLVWFGDKLGIGSGPINDYTAIDSITERELRECENVGNIYQDAKIIMGDMPGHI